MEAGANHTSKCVVYVNYQSKVELAIKYREPGARGAHPSESVPMEAELETHVAKLRTMRLSNDPANFRLSQKRSHWMKRAAAREAFQSSLGRAALKKRPHGEKQPIVVRPVSPLCEGGKSEKNAARRHQTSWNKTLCESQPPPTSNQCEHHHVQYMKVHSGPSLYRCHFTAVFIKRFRMPFQS